MHVVRRKIECILDNGHGIAQEWLISEDVYLAESSRGHEPTLAAIKLSVDLFHGNIATVLHPPEQRDGDHRGDDE